ncbi:uncharacterized protein [Clytia hemisphaerica]|uniref:uncharacterized protein n=1 Tax=Clytia hemisphaerica TaxID=252671 RepID=UPI0034D74F4E
MKTFTLCYGAAEVKLRLSQINQRNIGRSFQITDTTGIFLKHGSNAEFTNDHANFDLGDYADKTIFNVCISGVPQASQSQPQPSSSTDVTSSTPATNSAQQSTPRQPPSSLQRIARKPLATVKVVRADVGENGKPTNVHFHNLSVHVNLYSEEQANIPFILGKVNEEINDDYDLVLVGANGLSYYDQEGTRGVAFWKVGSRKVFAVPREDISNRRRRSLEEIETTSPTPNKRRRSLHEESTLDNVVGELTDIKGALETFKKLAFKHHFSAAFLHSLEEAFSCCICHRYPALKPMGCQQCGTLVSCQACSDRHFGSSNVSAKTCPKCRCERGLAHSFRLRGFDNLIDQIKIMENEESDIDDNEDDGLGGAFDDTLPVIPDS